MDKISANHITSLSRTPTAFRNNLEYTELKPGNNGEPPESQITATAELLLELISKDQLVLNKDGTASPAEKANTKKATTFEPRKDGIGFSFEGVDLPDNTVLDLLGWLLSVTNIPADSAEPRTWYLQLLALYAKWCIVLAGNKSGIPPMVHISWFPGAKSQKVVLLGSTIGKIPELNWAEPAPKTASFKAMTIINERQRYMIEAGFVSQQGQEVDIRNAVDGQGFGICAETFFYLVARGLGLRRLNEQNVRGLALRPDHDAFRKLAAYDEATAIQALAGPCAYSCQKLIPQLGALGNPKQSWDWRVSFGPESVLGGVHTAGHAPPNTSGSTAGYTASSEPRIGKTSRSKAAASPQPTAAGQGFGSQLAGMAMREGLKAALGDVKE
ncbi:MAG: hypothetical protein HETSPECPRED_001693 [Heterodermia speciosa]|uniref:Uncharacterized protein n=1 Tax=Heterodermia speciosa TaxID=116794 RepID=A0A8H3IHK0_9LECA|nr:MAG: hypothetical protein HETSPECPRED_001693 [Heterodermia speciosa]